MSTRTWPGRTDVRKIKLMMEWVESGRGGQGGVKVLKIKISLLNMNFKANYSNLATLTDHLVFIGIQRNSHSHLAHSPHRRQTHSTRAQVQHKHLSNTLSIGLIIAASNTSVPQITLRKISSSRRVLLTISNTARSDPPLHLRCQ